MREIQVQPVDVSIVICSHHRADGLLLALSSLSNQVTDGKFEYEIVVIHADGPGTERAISEAAKHSKVRIRSICDRRVGAIVARNRAIDEARGEWLALFDDDQTAEPKWLLSLWDVAHKYRSRNVGGVLFLNYEPGLERPLSTNCRRMLGETVKWKSERPYTAQEGPGSGNQLIHRSIFDEIGRMDENETLRNYDKALYSRMYCAGIQSWFTPHAVSYRSIPSWRLSDDYFHELAIQNGWQLAKRDRLVRGDFWSAIRAFAHVAQAKLIHAPALAAALAIGNQEAILDRRVKLWQADGYSRATSCQCEPAITQTRSLRSRSFTTAICRCDSRNVAIEQR